MFDMLLGNSVFRRRGPYEYAVGDLMAVIDAISTESKEHRIDEAVGDTQSTVGVTIDVEGAPRTDVCPPLAQDLVMLGLSVLTAAMPDKMRGTISGGRRANVTNDPTQLKAVFQNDRFSKRQ